MLNLIRRLLPANFIRYLGRLQFSVPLLAPLIRWAGRKSTTGIQTVQFGRARGLRIDNTMGFPGYATGTTEPEEQDALWRLLKPGDTFVNIGANIGFHALIGARRVEQLGRVIAVEPIAEVAQMITKNAGLNDFTNVTVIQAACSRASGKARIFTGASSATNSLFKERSQGDNSVEVDVVTLDEIVVKMGLTPNLISIDIEGAEIDCLYGALATIQRCRPTILLENHWLQAPFYAFYDTELSRLGYVLENLNGSAYERVPTPMRDHVVARVPDGNTERATRRSENDKL